MNFLAAYTMQGRMQAVIVASVLAMLSLLFSPISILSASAIALVTLRKGQLEGVLVIAGAGIAVALLSGLLFGGFFFGIAYALGFWLPIWIIAVVLRESGRLGVTFEITLIFGLVVIGTIYFSDLNSAEFWQQSIQLILQPLIDGSANNIQSDQIEHWLSVASEYSIGILVTGTVSTLVLALLVARWWQANLYNPGGFGKEFLSVESRPLVAYICLGVLLVAILGAGTMCEMARDMSILVFFMYLVIGIAVLHVLVSATKAHRFLLPAFYVIVLLIPHAMLPVALVGFTDTWQNWRRRVIFDGSV